MSEKFKSNSIQNLDIPPRNSRLFLYKKHTRPFFFKSTGGGLLENGLPLFVRTSAGELCLSNPQFTPLDRFMMATMRKG